MVKLDDKLLIGTATSAAQIEVSGDHNWRGIKAKDGTIFDKTIAHDKHRDEDLYYISKLGNFYRGGLDWSKLQHEPYGDLESKVVKEYRNFFGKLKDNDVKLMLVLHHFTNPMWFEKKSPWPRNRSVGVFVDYAKKVVDAFSDLVDYWNTINEPVIYSSMAYLFATFPPFKVNLYNTYATLVHLKQAHDEIYDYIKEKDEKAMVGFAKNFIVFHGENPLGKVVEWIGNFFYRDYILKLFSKSDYIGVNYYGRLPFNPWPISEQTWPGKLDKMKREHDDMWEYYPQGLETVLNYVYSKYEKPIFVTENGTSTQEGLNDDFRIKYIADHLKYLKKAQDNGVPVLGYAHWSAFDNYEWAFGQSKRFGLVYVDYNTERRMLKRSGEFYSKIVETHNVPEINS